MRYLCNKCETKMKENLSDPISWKSKGIEIISLHWESNHFFPRKLLRLLDFVSCSSPMSMSFISSCLSFLVCLKALDFKVAISKGATAAASEWSLGQGFCVLNVLSMLYFHSFGWGTKVYVQNRSEPSNNILHRFCLTRESTLTSQDYSPSSVVCITEPIRAIWLYFLLI